MQREPNELDLAARKRVADQIAKTMMRIPDPIPCPYVYAKGRRCKGHIVRIEAFKADLEWSMDRNGQWHFACGEPRSHYHLYCSEKGNHAGHRRDDGIKIFCSELPKEISAVVSRTAS